MRVDDVVGILQKTAILFFAALQLFFDLPALRDVLHMRRKVAYFSVTFIDSRTFHQHRESRAVPANVQRFKGVVAVFARGTDMFGQLSPRLGRKQINEGSAD